MNSTCNNDDCHFVKIHPQYFGKVLSGDKRAEVRINDRNYKKSDVMVLREFDPDTAEYTGRSIECVITDVTDISSLFDFDDDLSVGVVLISIIVTEFINGDEIILFV